MKEVIVNAALTLKLQVPDNMTQPEQVDEIENLIREGEFFPWQVDDLKISIESRPA